MVWQLNMHTIRVENKPLWVSTKARMANAHVLQSVGRVSSSGGGGGKLPPQNTQLPPQKEREKEEKRKRREREREREKERERERCMVWEGERVYFCVAVQVISIVSYFMTQLFKSTR